MRFLTDEVDKAGKQLSTSADQLGPYLKKLCEEEKYAEYIILGTSLIEFVLQKLVLAHDHSINFSLLVADMMSGTISPNEIRIISRDKKKSTRSAGTQLGDLNKFFGFHFYNDGLAARVMELIQNRNDVIHDLIEKYDGNLEKANNAFKTYAIGEPIQDIFIQLLKVQERLALDNRVKNEAAQKMKPK